MSKSANKTLIGAFVVGALALLVAAVAVFGSGRLFKSAAIPFVMFFDKSSAGSTSDRRWFFVACRSAG